MPPYILALSMILLLTPDASVHPHTVHPHTVHPHMLALSSADALASARWYEEKLGFEITMTLNDPERDIRIAFARRGDFHLEIVESGAASTFVELLPERPEVDRKRYLVHGVFKFGLRVDDAAAVAAHLESLGVTLKGRLFVDERFRVKQFLVTDPDGNTLQVFEELAPRAEPTARTGHAMAHDRRRGRVVVFGGLDGPSDGPDWILGDTWEWDGDRWIPVDVPGPGARSWAVAAWDDVRGKIVLFGGKLDRDESFGDTWEYDGATWRRAAISGPEPRSHHAMAYDPERRRLVLFGGHHDDTLFGDTWEWDGGTWTRKEASGPSARALHSMAYDSRRGRVLLFGGAVDSERLDDLWEWDGENWSRLGSGPRPRALASMAYDEERHKLVLFGGWQEGFTAEGDTWEWDGHVWAQLATSGPSPRGGLLMVYDTRRRGVVLFGGGGGEQDGFARSGEIWRWDGRVWSER